MADHTKWALELYARGYTATREEAIALVNENPEGVTVLLALEQRYAHADREMRDPRDKATGDNW